MVSGPLVRASKTGTSTDPGQWFRIIDPNVDPNAAQKAALTKKCRKIKKALRKASGSKKRRLAKKLRKCKKKLRAL